MGGLGFKTTHWTLIVRAQGSETHKRAAIDEIASNYRLPLIRYARARGLSTDRAEDLVQSLFVTLLAHNFVTRLDPERGRLRSFLKRALDHELLHAIERDRAQRRGGGVVTRSIDELEARRRTSRRGEAGRDLRARMGSRRSGPCASGAEAGIARRCPEGPMAGDREVPERGVAHVLRDAAQLARITVAQFKVTLHRARRRFEELLREEIGATVKSETELAEEEQTVKAELLA